MSGFNKRSRLSSPGSGKPSTAQPGSAESDKKASGTSSADSGNARVPTKKLKWSMNDLMNKLDNPDAPLADAKAAVEIAPPPAPVAKKATEEKPIVTSKKAVESVVPEARKATEKAAPEAKKQDSKPKDDGKRKQEEDITAPVTDWAEPAPVQGGDWESAKTGSSDSWAEPAANKDPVWAPIEEGASPQWAETTSEKKDDLWGKSAGGEIPSTWEVASAAEVKDSESKSAQLWGESKSIADVADGTTVPNSWEEMEGGVSGWDDSGSKGLGDRSGEEKTEAEPTGAKAEKGGSPADDIANSSINKEDVSEVPNVEWEEPNTTASESDWGEPTTKPVPSIPKAAGAASILSASAKVTVSQAVSLGTEGIAKVAREAEKRDAEHIQADTLPSKPVEPVAQAAPEEAEPEPVSEAAPVEAIPEPVSEGAAKSNDVVSTEDDLAPEPVSESKAEVAQATPAVEIAETQPTVEEVAAEPEVVSEAVAVEVEPVAKETAIEVEPTKEESGTVEAPEIEAVEVEPVSDEKPEEPNAATDDNIVEAEPVSSASTATLAAPEIEQSSPPSQAAQSAPPAVPSSALNTANQNETSMIRITPADILGSAPAPPPPPPAPVKKSILGAAAMLMKKAAAKKTELIEGHVEPVKSAVEPVKSEESTAESAISSSSPPPSESSPPEPVAATLPPLPVLPNIQPGVQMETGKFSLSTLQENIDARAKEVAAAAELISPTPSPKSPSQFEPTAQSAPPSQFDKVDIAFQTTEQDLEALHKPESEPSSKATSPEPAQGTPAEPPNAVPSARPERPVDRPSSLGSSVLGKMAAAVPLKPQPEPTDESDEEGANKGGLLPDMLRHKTSLPGHSAHPLRPAPVRIKAKELRKKASKESFRHTRLLYSASAALLLVCTAWMGYSIYDKLSSIDRVKNAFGAKHYEDAMQEIDNAMVRFPNESSLYLYKGKLLSLQHKPKDALEALSRAQTLEPENPEVLKERAAVFASQGNYKLASADLSQIMSSPTMATPEVAALLGSIELRMGEFRKAWTDYHHASQMDPANDSYKANVAASCIGQGEYKLAIEECDKILKKNPRDANALAHKGYALYKQKHQDKGLEIINKSISVKPTAYAYFYRGLIKADHKNPADSAQDFALARKFDPNNPLIIRAQIQSLASSGKRAKAIDELANLQGSAGSQEIESERASIAMADGKYKQAAEEYAKILAQKPDDVKVRLKHAECCEKAGEFAQAAEDYTKLLEKSSNSVQYYVKRAVVYNKEKQYKLSDNDIEHAVGINPNDPQIYLARASISEGQKHFQEALVDADHALRLAPTNESAIKKEHELGKYRPPAEKPAALPPPPPHITKTGDPVTDGYHYMQIGDVSSAVENFAKAIRKDPNNKVARRYLAYALLGKGQTSEALVQFRALLAMHAFTEEDEAKYVDLLSRTGKKDDAIAFCQSCLSANPNLGLLKLALGRLYLDRDQVDQAAEALKGCTVKSPEDYRKLQELNDDIQNRINIRQLQVNPGVGRRN